MTQVSPKVKFCEQESLTAINIATEWNLKHFTFSRLLLDNH